jgi:methyltransferase (TIGR00027 family)
MRHDRPSFTATAIAFWRGIAGLEEPQLAPDPVAEQLVPAPWRQALALARRMPRASSALLRLADRVARGRIRHIAFRTRAIDDVIAAGLAAGIRQIVVLGAGLDARAWRLSVLRDAPDVPDVPGVIVFEVDHPASQAYKRERLAAVDSAAEPYARDVRFVGVDFERDSLTERLSAAGHDLGQPSVFVWEGVIMYLTTEAVHATLSALSALAAEGSLLAVSYCIFPGVGPVSKAVLSLAGEPIRTRLEPRELAALLARHGFEATSDAGDREWARIFGTPPGTAGDERLTVARRTASQPGSRS